MSLQTKDDKREKKVIAICAISALVAQAQFVHQLIVFSSCM
jgi:hypothetical protein